MIYIKFILNYFILLLVFNNCGDRKVNNNDRKNTSINRGLISEFKSLKFLQEKDINIPSFFALDKNKDKIFVFGGKKFLLDQFGNFPPGQAKRKLGKDEIEFTSVIRLQSHNSRIYSGKFNGENVIIKIFPGQKFYEKNYDSQKDKVLSFKTYKEISKSLYSKENFIRDALSKIDNEIATQKKVISIDKNITANIKSIFRDNEGNIWLIMDKIENDTSYLIQNQYKYIITLANKLKKLHDKGIFHTDLNDQNVIGDKIIDWDNSWSNKAGAPFFSGIRYSSEAKKDTSALCRVLFYNIYFIPLANKIQAHQLSESKRSEVEKILKKYNDFMNFYMKNNNDFKGIEKKAVELIDLTAELLNSKGELGKYASIIIKGAKGKYDKIDEFITDIEREEESPAIKANTIALEELKKIAKKEIQSVLDKGVDINEGFAKGDIGEKKYYFRWSGILDRLNGKKAPGNSDKFTFTHKNYRYFVDMQTKLCRGIKIINRNTDLINKLKQEYNDDIDQYDY